VTANIILTASLVSIDAFFVGMFVKAKQIVQIMIILTLSSLLAYIVSNFLMWVEGEIAVQISGIIFIILGAKNLWSEDKGRDFSMWSIIALGSAMSVDVVIATLTLCLEGVGILSPIVVMIGHGVAFFLGLLIAKVGHGLAKIKACDGRAMIILRRYLPSIGLMTVGLLKIFGGV
jgi:putative Mn2+ efflux pump MntP